MREALDWLRDHLAVVYEREGGRIFHDPWQARDGYIDVILDRSEASVARLMTERLKVPDEPEVRQKALRLLEMQRNAMLMYTSCGWFFSDISGIEAVQNLQYAARAVELAREAAGVELEGGLTARLKLAPSNYPVHRDGEGGYRNLAAAGRVPVIASGHIADDPAEQAREMNAIAKTGVAALILVTNRLAGQDESDDVWKRRCERLFAELPREVPLGFYECPHPHKRLFTPELLRWCAETGRVTMLKDTCCDAAQIRLRQRAVEGTRLGIYNANAATLLETLRYGIAGYSGVMANFHPQLYVWLCRNWPAKPAEAERLQAWLGAASAIEGPLYPRNAKYFLQLDGLPITTVARRAIRELGPADRRLIEQFRAVSQELSRTYAPL